MRQAGFEPDQFQAHLINFSRSTFFQLLVFAGVPSRVVEELLKTFRYPDSQLNKMNTAHWSLSFLLALWCVN